MRWWVYESIEPFGEAGASLRAGIIASVIANANRDPKRKKDPFTPEDFMVRVKEAEAKPGWERDLMMMKHLAALQNARVEREQQEKEKK